MKTLGMSKNTYGFPSSFTKKNAARGIIHYTCCFDLVVNSWKLKKLKTIFHSDFMVGTMEGEQYGITTIESRSMRNTHISLVDKAMVTKYTDFL
jgi:hypothetical protein